MHLDGAKHTNLEYDRHDKNAFGLELDDGSIDVSVLLSDVKTELNVTHTEHDAKLRRNIRTATRDVERWIGRAIFQREHIAYWRLAYEWVELPRPPHVSITTVERIDEDGASTTIASSDYETKGNKALKIILDEINTTDALKVTYQAGYGKILSDIPQGIQDGIIEQVPLYYQMARPDGGLEIDPQSRLTIAAHSAVQSYKYYYRGF